jgi:hypothetical protein
MATAKASVAKRLLDTDEWNKVVNTRMDVFSSEKLVLESRENHAAGRSCSRMDAEALHSLRLKNLNAIP